MYCIPPRPVMLLILRDFSQVHPGVDMGRAPRLGSDSRSGMICKLRGLEPWFLHCMLFSKWLVDLVGCGKSAVYDGLLLNLSLL